MRSEVASFPALRLWDRKAEPMPAQCGAVPAGKCGCGGMLRQTGAENCLLIDLGPAGWRVIRSLRPVRNCADCGQPGEPCCPRLSASSSALSQMLVARYDQHQPLYRQAEAMAEQGLTIKRSILADLIAEACGRLAPVAEEVRAQGLRAPLLNAGNAPVSNGRADHGRLWAYVADPRGWGGAAPPLIWYRYTPNRSGAHAIGELASYGGVLQAAAHEGYDRLWARETATEAGCWAAVRRRALDIQRGRPHALLTRMIEQIDHMTVCEERLHGEEADARVRLRRERTAPIIEELGAILDTGRKEVPPRSAPGKLVAEVIERWPALTRLLDDGRIAIDNRVAEHALRALAAGRNGWLFGGSRDAGHRAATIYTLIETCKLNAIDPRAYLADTLAKLMTPSPPAPIDVMPWMKRRK